MSTHDNSATSCPRLTHRAQPRRGPGADRGQGGEGGATPGRLGVHALRESVTRKLTVQKPKGVFPVKCNMCRREWVEEEAMEGKDMSKGEERDPLAEMILDLHGRLERLEQDRRVTNSLVRTLGQEMGYELVVKEQGGGKMVASWERKSGLVTL